MDRLTGSEPQPGLSDHASAESRVPFTVTSPNERTEKVTVSIAGAAGRARRRADHRLPRLRDSRQA